MVVNSKGGMGNNDGQDSDDDGDDDNGSYGK